MVHVHLLGFPGMGGIGSTRARVPHGRVTNYVSNGAAKLTLRNPLRSRDGPGRAAHEEGPGALAAQPGGLGDDPNLQHEDRAVDGEPEYIIHQRIVSSANARKRRAANWESTEETLANMMLKDRLPHPCDCARRDVVTVRCIDLSLYEDRVFEYCNCARSCSSLLIADYFPCAPVRPRTAFSIRLLQLLHEQSVLGYVSRSAWSGGLKALYESEKKEVLPAFDREVSTPPHRAVPLNNEIL
jgi:CxC1 like cysteine cluster associated with KDZ transposases